MNKKNDRATSKAANRCLDLYSKQSFTSKFANTEGLSLPVYYNNWKKKGPVSIFVPGPGIYRDSLEYWYQ